MSYQQILNLLPYTLKAVKTAPHQKALISDSYVSFVETIRIHEEVDFELLKIMTSIGGSYTKESALYHTNVDRKKKALLSAYLIALRYLYNKCYNTACDDDKCVCNDPRAWPDNGLPLVTTKNNPSLYF